MSLHEAHEHVFYAHDDPRWLICDCGQYGVRSRTTHGQFTIRLIDPPRPIFGVPCQADVTTTRVTTVDVSLTRAAADARADDVTCTDGRSDPDPAVTDTAVDLTTPGFGDDPTVSGPEHRRRQPQTA